MRVSLAQRTVLASSTWFLLSTGCTQPADAPAAGDDEVEASVEALSGSACPGQTQWWRGTDPALRHDVGRSDGAGGWYAQGEIGDKPGYVVYGPRSPFLVFPANTRRYAAFDIQAGWIGEGTVYGNIGVAGRRPGSTTREWVTFRWVKPGDFHWGDTRTSERRRICLTIAFDTRDFVDIEFDVGFHTMAWFDISGVGTY